ncbi:MAG: hypothetical protein IKG11_02360, partial [Atopobiaceae bacterium]|nr:hypothetical protein [Atopobiaceae bacterium]
TRAPQMAAVPRTASRDGFKLRIVYLYALELGKFENVINALARRKLFSLLCGQVIKFHHHLL